MVISKIMVVIDPTADRQPAFERALDSARMTAAARSSASMVFKSSFDHSSVQREIRQTADWTRPIRTSWS